MTDTAKLIALKGAGITGASEAICFAKGWEAAIAAASDTAEKIGKSFGEAAIGHAIAKTIISLKD